MSGEEMSKSARKRANQKAREAAVAEEAAAAAAPPPPAAKSKAKAKAEPKAEAAPKAKAAAEPKAEAKAKAKGKAKAEPKAEAKAAPAPAAKAEAKAKAKGAAKAAEPAPAAAEAKPKAKGKAKAKKEEAPAAPVRKKSEDVVIFEMDDGKGGDWEVAAGVTKKQQKRKENAEQKVKDEEQARIQALKDAKAAEKAVAAGGSAAAANGSKKTGANMMSVAEILAQAKIKGQSEADAKAATRALENAARAPPAKDGEAAAAPVVDPNQTSASVKVPQEKIGRVIGPKGANITLIKEKTGVKSVDTAGDMVTLVGDKEAVAMAEAAVKELLERGYMSIAFEDFKQDEVSVNPECIPNLIGSRGAIIQVIKKECAVEIDIPPVPKNAPAGKKVKVSIAGGAVGVEKAKEVVNSIALYSHHEMTHPGFTHAEMEVEEWRYRFLIGKGGSEMRHIQNNYKVRVNIPREGSASDKVVIIGEEQGVERAVKYITKILEEAEKPTGRDKPEKAEDTWGPEGPEEPWMSAYMYKRRP